MHRFQGKSSQLKVPSVGEHSKDQDLIRFADDESKPYKKGEGDKIPMSDSIANAQI